MSYSAEVAWHRNNNMNLAFSGVSHVNLRATSLVQTDDGTSFRLLRLSQQRITGVPHFCCVSHDMGRRQASSQRAGEKDGHGLSGAGQGGKE